MNQYVNLIVDNDNVSIKPENNKAYCEMDYIYAYPGIVNEFKGIEELKEKSIIEEIFYYKEKGNEIKQKVVSGDLVMRY